jgi:TorA-specific chaperone
MTDTHNNDPAVHAARASLYATVAAAFDYPTESTFEDLTDSDAMAGIRSAAERLGFQAEADALLDALDATSQSALASMYNALFGIPEDGTYPVVPYEANYTVGSETDQQQRRIATVVGLMEAFGVEPSEDFTERQDHIASELELAQVLAAQRAVALESGDEEGAQRIAEAEATFLDRHLIDFIPSFARRVRDATSSETYLAAVDLVEALVEWDRSRHPDPTVEIGQFTEPAEVNTDA